MKPTLGLNLTQNLVITPQLQQAIHFLQLSTLDLQQEIQQVMQDNPLLELEDEEHLPVETHQDKNSDSTEDTSSLEDAHLDTWQDDTLPDELAVDANWDDVYSHDYNSSSYSTANSYGLTPSEDYDTNTYSQSLQDHLLWQLNLNINNPHDRLIGTSIIDSLGTNGYLEEDLEELTEGLQKNHPELKHLELEEVEIVLKLIQGFEPAGVAARSLKECLLIQLNQLAEDTPFLTPAKQLVDNYLEMLASKDFNFLKRRLKLKNDEELAQVVTLIQAQNPRPGEAHNNSQVDYLIPDLILTFTENGWAVELNPDAQPKLRVNNSYPLLIQQADTNATKDYLKGHHRDAQWLIKSLQNRSETLLKVGKEIVEKQQKFFTHGEEYMQPLILSDIAEMIDMHESTVSRATTQKYIHTPKGIFELKYFFSSNLSTSSGEDTSSTAIKALIKKFISEEPAKKPLSDNKLAQMLVAQGIQVARRTVAKYRESMNLPPSNERKRLS